MPARGRRFPRRDVVREEEPEVARPPDVVRLEVHEQVEVAEHVREASVLVRDLEVPPEIARDDGPEAAEEERMGRRREGARDSRRRRRRRRRPEQELQSGEDGEQEDFLSDLKSTLSDQKKEVSILKKLVQQYESQNQLHQQEQAELETLREMIEEKDSFIHELEDKNQEVLFQLEAKDGIISRISTQVANLEAEVYALNKRARSNGSAQDQIHLDELSRLKQRSNADFRALLSVHEAGHGLVYALLFGQPPEEIRINVASFEGGYNSFGRLKAYSSRNCLDMVCVSLAGRAAEALVFGDSARTTGAEPRACTPWRRAARMRASSSSTPKSLVT